MQSVSAKIVLHYHKDNNFLIKQSFFFFYFKIYYFCINTFVWI